MENYLRLMVSKNTSSRKEFIDMLMKDINKNNQIAKAKERNKGMIILWELD